MSNIAKDKNGETVYADTIALSRKDETFYCRSKECNAPLTLISPSVKEQKTISAHFSNRDKKHKHVEGCFYASGLLANAMRYSTTNFEMEKLFNIVSNRSPLKTSKNGIKGSDTKQGNSRSLELKTVANTYYRFITSDLDSIINGVRIGDMFACERNHKQYERSAKGYVLMELKYKNCYWGTRGEENHLSMYCLFPHTRSEDSLPKITWQLRFTDPNVLDEVEYKIHRTLHGEFCKKYSEAKNAGKEVIIAVLGYWEGRRCRIHSANQINIIKPEIRNTM